MNNVTSSYSNLQIQAGTIVSLLATSRCDRVKSCCKTIVKRVIKYLSIRKKVQKTIMNNS